MDGALRPRPRQRGHTGAGQVIGMDVVGVDVVLGPQHRRAAQQTFARMAAFAILRVDAGNAKDRHARASSNSRAGDQLGGKPSGTIGMSASG